MKEREMDIDRCAMKEEGDAPLEQEHWMETGAAWVARGGREIKETDDKGSGQCGLTTRLHVHNHNEQGKCLLHATQAALFPSVVAHLQQDGVKSLSW